MLVVLACAIPAAAVTGRVQPPATAIRPALPDWYPLLLLVTWAVAEGFRGRAPSTPAAWVAFTGALAWAVADTITLGGAPAVRRWEIVPLSITATVAAGAARTIGLLTDSGANAAMAAGASVALVGVWALWVGRARLR